MHKLESPQLRDQIQEFYVYAHIYLDNFCVGVHGFIGNAIVGRFFILFTSHLFISPSRTLLKNFTCQKACETVGEAVPYHRWLPASSLVAPWSMQGA